MARIIEWQRVEGFVVCAAFDVALSANVLCAMHGLCNLG
jgi:hypothetical protein